MQLTSWSSRLSVKPPSGSYATELQGRQPSVSSFVVTSMLPLSVWVSKQFFLDASRQAKRRLRCQHRRASSDLKRVSSFRECPLTVLRSCGMPALNAFGHGRGRSMILQQSRSTSAGPNCSCRMFLRLMERGSRRCTPRCKCLKLDDGSRQLKGDMRYSLLPTRCNSSLGISARCCITVGLHAINTQPDLIAVRCSIGRIACFFGLRQRGYKRLMTCCFKGDHPYNLQGSCRSSSINEWGWERFS